MFSVKIEAHFVMDFSHSFAVFVIHFSFPVDRRVLPDPSWKKLFFMFLIESHNPRLESRKDIDWSQVQAAFPSQTRVSLQKALDSAMMKRKPEELRVAMDEARALRMPISKFFENFVKKTSCIDSARRTKKNLLVI